MLYFHNPGEIDIRGATVAGLSAKEGDTPIGFFGTGLKYALATALRFKCQVIIHSGTKTHIFWLKNETIRGKPFDTIQMQTDRGDFVDLGFTTELGKTWELWMSYREFLCNALDEGASFSEAGFETSEKIMPRDCVQSGSAV